MYDAGAARNRLQGVLFHLYQLNVKDERGKRWYRLARALLAISEVVGDEEAVFGPLLHELQTLGPALDHLIETKRGRLSALVGTVENLTVCEFTLIIAPYLA